MRTINNIYNTDCISGMREVKPASVDLIITDPPFAIDFKAQRANYNRTSGRVLEGYNEIGSSEYFEFSQKWLTEAVKLCKESASIFIFSGWNYLRDILNAAESLNLTLVNHIIWKYQFGVVCKRKFVTSHYHCLYYCLNDKMRKFFNNSRFSQDDRTPDGGSLRYQDLEDVWYIKREYWHGDVKTPTKLPSEIIKKILYYTSEKGDLVLDPFIGSGQVAFVAKDLERNYIGFEIVKDYYEFAQRRLSNNEYRIRHDENIESFESDLKLF